MRLKPKTPMDYHNAEKPDDVLADLEAKHGSSPTAGSALTSRQLEIKQLEIAIGKTKAAQVRADQTLDAIRDKLMGQIAELRFQKLMARMDAPNAEAQRPEAL